MFRLKVKKLKDKGKKVRIGAFLKERKATKYEYYVGLNHIIVAMLNRNLCSKEELAKTLLKYIDNFGE